jgi:hypothetical protein
MDVYLQYLLHLGLTDLLNIKQLLLLFHIPLKLQYYLIHEVGMLGYSYLLRRWFRPN